MISLLSLHSAIVRYWNQYKLKKLKFRYFGTNIKICPNFKLGHRENIFINAQGGVEIGSGTITGPDVMIFSVNHIYDSEILPFAEELSLKPVVIGENCWIGARVFICPGVSIGEGSVVAANSVVTKNFPPCSVIGGNPAKLIKTKNKEMYSKAKEKSIYNTFIKAD